MGAVGRDQNQSTGTWLVGPLWYFLALEVLATRLDWADDLQGLIAEIQDPTLDIVTPFYVLSC